MIALEREAAPFTLRECGNRDSVFAPIVCLHGWGSHSECWAPLLAHLGDQCHFLWLDLPGFGLNRHWQEDSPTRFCAAVLAELPPRFHLLGWSLGGMLALHLAALAGERALSLTCLATNAKFVASEDWPDACAREVFSAFVEGFARDPAAICQRFTLLQAQGDKARKALLADLRALHQMPSDAQQAGWLRALQWLDLLDNRPLLGQLPCPLSLVFGEGDILVPVAAASDVAEFAAPGTQITRLPGVGHAPQLSAAGRVARVLLSNVRRAEQPFARDKDAVARSFNGAAHSYDQSAQVQRRVAERLLSDLPPSCRTVVDLGCGTGFSLAPLVAPGRELLGIDIAPAMLAEAARKLRDHADFVCADFDALPLAEACCDAVVSSMSLQWCSSLTAVFSQLHRALVPGGTLLFATLGPQTLAEFAQAWRAVDDCVHINAFEAVEEVLSALAQAGFQPRHCQRRTEIAYYPDTLSLMRALRGVGAHNMNAGRRRAATTRRDLETLAQAFESFRRPEGLPARYDVIYILAERQ